MKNISKNIKTILGAALLSLALIGSIISISQINSDLNETAAQEELVIDLEKSISVLP